MPPESSTTSAPSATTAASPAKTAASTAASTATAHPAPRSDLRTLEAGLDALQTFAPAEKPTWRRRVDGVVPPILLLVALIAAWQLFVVIAQPRPDLFPGPADVASAFTWAWETGRVQLAVATSLERGVLGFAIAVAIGTPLGLLLAEVRWLRRALGPIISGLQVLPSVAWVPAAILWFGLTDATVYFVVVMGAAPSIANGLVSGVAQVPPQLRRVGTVLGASRLQQALLVVLPGALPGYVSGLKQGWAFSWRSLMAAEIIATGGSIGFGLGAMLDQSRELADLAAVLTTIIVILGIGILVELLFFAPIERRLLRGRGLLVGAGAR